MAAAFVFGLHFLLTFRVAEPEGLARRLPTLANGVTDQGLGEVSAANEAGNPVLGDGQSHWVCLDGKPNALYCIHDTLYCLLERHCIRTHQW